MKLRPATIEDIPQIALLWREMADMHAAWQPMYELIAEPEEAYLAHIKANLAKDNYLLIVAEIENEIIGYSTLSFSKRPELFLKKLSASIEDTCVKAEYRKAGIGRQLTKELIKIARERGVELITLGVEVNNEVGNIFWKEMGFKPAVNRMAMYLV